MMVCSYLRVAGDATFIEKICMGYVSDNENSGYLNVH